MLIACNNKKKHPVINMYQAERMMEDVFFFLVSFSVFVRTFSAISSFYIINCGRSIETGLSNMCVEREKTMLYIIAYRGKSKNILKFLCLHEFQSHNVYLLLRVNYIQTFNYKEEKIITFTD